MIKNKLDQETKMELLIALAFGIPIEDLSKQYALSKAKIINLRKNNYIVYNQFFNHWKIHKDVAVLGLSAKHERALSIVKKFYKSRIKIISESSIWYDTKQCTLTEITEMADKILQKDNICCFKQLGNDIKNHY